MVKTIYFPTVEACWDFGISRNAPLLPFLGSTLPYSFLRGVQFDTKVFKMSEFLENGVNGVTNLFTNSKARNEVIFSLTDEVRMQNALENSNTQTIEPKTTNGGVTNSVVSNSTMNINKDSFISKEFHIAVENDSDVTSSITNKWSAGEDILTQAIQGVAEIAKNITEIGRTVGYTIGPKEWVENLGVPFSPARYKGTDFGTITLNFNLFTRNNYIRDIFIPLERLKALCLPRRTDDVENSHERLMDFVAETLNSLPNVDEEMANVPPEFRQDVVSTVEAIEKVIAAMKGRFKLVKSPPTFSVKHSSDLFFLKKAVVTSFTYKPVGPWIRVEYDGLFSKVFGINSSIGNALDRLLRDEYVKFATYPNTYPSRIACSMTLQETDFITLEDYVEKLSSDPNLIKTAIATLASQNGLTSSLLAGGIAQNLDVLTPDVKGVGDLLSGGKWVPPGETMSGIPGFL